MILASNHRLVVLALAGLSLRLWAQQFLPATEMFAIGNTLWSPLNKGGSSVSGVPDAGGLDAGGLVAAIGGRHAPPFWTGSKLLAADNLVREAARRWWPERIDGSVLE